MMRAFSVSDALFTRSKQSETGASRMGVMAAVNSMAHLRTVFPQLLERFPYRSEPEDLPSAPSAAGEEAMDVINIALRPPEDATDDEKLLRKHLMPFVQVGCGVF